MPSVEDWINNPLGIIQTMFDKNGNCESSLVRDYFGEKLQTEKALSWIPSLNDTPLHKLRANSLVRYRCMIQDMYDPEFFLGKYEVKDSQSGQTSMRSGKYKDVAECGLNQSIDIESKNNITMDRMTLYTVPVPGEADWVKKSHGDLSRTKMKSYPSTSKMPARTKRGLDDELEINKEVRESMATSSDGASATNGTGDTSNVDMETESGEAKRQQTERQPEAGTSKGPDLNFPLPGEDGLACLVKVYDDINSFKVTDIVEFIGILSVDPSLAHFTPDSSSEEVMSVVEETEEELHAHAPPPSLVPRLHAVLSNHKKHVNPLLPPSNTDNYKSVLEAIQSDIDSIRAQLLSILEHALLGDTLAAQYFLCHLMSSVYGRADVIPLGKFCVNLSNCPRSPTYSELVHHLVSNLVTQSHLLHMSLENMNTQRFSPCKDYTANRLSTGILQVADKTNLVLDEMSLQAGQLDVNGVKNLQSLGNVISWQKVEYDFNYHKQDFHCNIATLILSEGKSILPSDSLLPLQPSVQVDDLREYFTLLDPRLTEDLLTKCRTYIGLARSMDYTLTDDIQQVIQNDFVDMRKADPKTMSVDDFHSLLCLTRLLSLVELKTSPSLDIWNKAKSMEQQRKSRISHIAARNQASA